MYVSRTFDPILAQLKDCPYQLYLDEQHLEWMSERVLQHVLSDLRPLSDGPILSAFKMHLLTFGFFNLHRILPKLIAEENVNLGPHGAGSAKKGTLDVHRGGKQHLYVLQLTFALLNAVHLDSYQFGYFLRNTEPHAVLIKTRRFTAAPPANKAAQASSARLESLSEASASPATKGGRKRANQGKGKAPAKRRSKAPRMARRNVADTDSEEEAIDVSDDEPEGSVAAVNSTTGALRRSTRRRTVKSGTYTADDESEDQDAADAHEAMAAGESTQRPSDPLAHDMMSAEQTVVKEEQVDTNIREDVQNEDVVMTEDPSATDHADAIVVEDDEEEEKPKPIMSLRYQGFSVHGRCLCVIVEPYPAIRQQRQMSLNHTGIRAPRAPSIAPADFVMSGDPEQRAKTPLFLPDFDDERRSVTPAPVSHRVRPPVPLFNEEPEEQSDDDGGMYAFSQILQSVNEHHTGAVDDDDEMEGMVLFGDADEAREL